MTCHEVSITDRTGARVTFPVGTGERLLHAGLAAGLGLPHECATGTCGNCKATLLQGEAACLWVDAPGRKVCRDPRELLLCQSAARGPLSLSIRTSFPEAANPCRSIRSRLSQRTALTPEIQSFSLELERPLSYAPGQFVLLASGDIDGPRAYSMTAHAPGTLMSLSFLARLKSGGAFTKALFHGRLDDAPIDVFGPLGRATLRPEDQRPFLAIAGGSGIAGMLSILDHAVASGHLERHPSSLVFGLRGPAEAYLLDALDHRVEASAGRLSVTIAFSDAEPMPEHIARYRSLHFTQGLAHEVAGRMLGAGEAPLVFLAGPPPMVDAAMRLLVVERKLSPRDIRYDRFG